MESVVNYGMDRPAMCESNRKQQLAYGLYGRCGGHCDWTVREYSVHTRMCARGTETVETQSKRVQSDPLLRRLGPIAVRRGIRDSHALLLFELSSELWLKSIVSGPQPAHSILGESWETLEGLGGRGRYA